MRKKFEGQLFEQKMRGVEFDFEHFFFDLCQALTFCQKLTYRNHDSGIL